MHGASMCQLGFWESGRIDRTAKAIKKTRGETQGSDAQIQSGANCNKAWTQEGGAHLCDCDRDERGERQGVDGLAKGDGGSRELANEETESECVR